jgi:hypothetical protein
MLTGVGGGRTGVSVAGGRGVSVVGRFVGGWLVDIGEDVACGIRVVPEQARIDNASTKLKTRILICHFCTMILLIYSNR